MRLLPQVGLLDHICRIRPMSSRLVEGRPPRDRDFQRQNRRKPWRCQPTTVRGTTITNEWCQPDHNRRSRTHRNRSELLSLGLGTERMRTAS